jgi:HSP20 family protein
MAIVRWDPATELAGMEVDRLNRMFADFYGGSFANTWVPSVEIFETENHETVIKVELPEVKREDINITFENNVLTLKGERKHEETIKRERVHRTERHYGSFTRSFTLSPSIEASKIAASYKDGVLTIRLPRREETKPKQIAVTVQ